MRWRAIYCKLFVRRDEYELMSVSRTFLDLYGPQAFPRTAQSYIRQLERHFSVHFNC